MARPPGEVVPTQLDLTNGDMNLIAAFAGCSLDESPGSNWVQEAGGLPEYLCEVARAVKRTGKSTSQAIAIAVSRMKVWATGKGVDKDTQAKAAKALAEWEAKRAKTHAKTAAKETMKATAITNDLTDTQILRLWALEPACELTATQKVIDAVRFKGDALEQILDLAKAAGTGHADQPHV